MRPYEQMVYAQHGICSTKWYKVLWVFGSLNLALKTRPYSNQPKNRTCKIVNFAVPADHRIKLKEREKKYKNLNFARDLKFMEHEGGDYTIRDWFIWYRK